MGQSPLIVHAKIKVHRVQYKGSCIPFPIRIYTKEPTYHGHTVFYLPSCLSRSEQTEWSRQRLKLMMRRVKRGKTIEIEYDHDTGIVCQIDGFELTQGE